MNARLYSLLIWIVFLFLSTTIYGQTYIMGESSGTITTCSGILENPGGFGSYADGLDVFQTICTGNGQCIQLTFTDFGTEGCCDRLTIYDGNSEFSYEIIEFAGTSNPGIVTSTDASEGCLTLKFFTDGSVGSTGFRANISCINCPTNFILGQGLDSLSTCSGIILDPGGSLNYEDSLNVSQTFCSSDSGQCLTLSFNSFNTELNFDVLSIYDGPNTNSELFGHFSGSEIPEPISSSSNSGGCLTLLFNTNNSINFNGFHAYLNCGNCSYPDLILGHGGDTIYTCGGRLLDPGSLNDYNSNQNITQTICSETPGQCVSLSFNSFNTEAVYDRLSVYDGPSNTSNLISIFSGNSIPPIISSSTNSEGCLTLVFTSNGSVNLEGFSADINCGICDDPFINNPLYCQISQALCLGQGENNYVASTQLDSEFGSPGPIGCLGATPNPAWFYFQVQDSGPIDIEITSGFDVDFICWGPFNQAQWSNGVCSMVLDPVWANDNLNSVSCSYSASPIEHCDISNTQSGEYYVLLVTNISNKSSIINIQQIDGIGTTNCSSLCDHTINTLVTECDSTNNTYSIHCTIYLPHPPLSGNVEIINSSGGILSFEAPFPDSLNFSFDHLASDGLQHSIEVSFSDQPNCTNSFFYTAPLACNACAVSASLLDSVSCTGFPIHLQASELPSVTYSWIGPNGFTSSEQNPIIANAELNMNGVYQLDVYNPIDSCHSIALVNVLVHQFPVDASMTGNEPICSGGSIILDVPDYSNAIYTWTKSDSTLISSSSSTYYLQPAILQDMGIYSCTINIEGCINTSQDEDVIIYQNPLIPYFDFNPLTNELYAMQSAGNFQWFLNNDPIIGQTQYHIHLEQQGNYSVTVSNDFGCVISSENFYFDPTGIPELPISRLALQPNPAKAYIQVLVPELGVLEVFDLAGKRLKEYKLQLGVNTISVNELAEGIYLFQFHSNSGVRLAKVIVEHN